MGMLDIIPSVATAGSPIQPPEVFERVRNKRLTLFAEENLLLISRAEAEDILAHSVVCLDPELRASDDFTRSYPPTVPVINERFVPFSST